MAALLAHCAAQLRTALRSSNTWKNAALAYCIWRLISKYIRDSQATHVALLTAPRVVARADAERFPHFFCNKDGIMIFHRHWVPRETPKAVVFLIHGFGEHSGRYEHVASEFVASGVAVFGIDHQGHGRSEGDRGHVVRFQDYVDDVMQYIREVVPRYPNCPVFLMGHSMGGAITVLTARDLTAAIQQQSPRGGPGHPVDTSLLRLDGVLLSAPLLAPDPDIGGPGLKAATRVLSHILPKLEVQPLDATLVSRDPQVVRAYVNDPLVYHGCIRARFAAEVLAALDVIAAYIPRVRWPFLVLQGGQDKLVEPSGATQLHSQALSTDKTIREYPELYHELFNEPERAEIIQLAVQWLLDRL